MKNEKSEIKVVNKKYIIEGRLEHDHMNYYAFKKSFPFNWYISGTTSNSKDETIRLLKEKLND